MLRSRRLRIGIIGAGTFAATHMDHFRSLENVEVTAFMRRDRKRLAEIQERWNVPEGYTDHRELLASPRVDAVGIITPSDSHKQIAIDAAKAGKHVLCEKPLALAAADCREMLKAAERASIIHSVNFNQRGNTALGRMKRYIDAGFIGDLIHANIWWGMTQQDRTRPEIPSWRFTKEKGGGTVYELSHVFDMARFIGGEVAGVVSLLHTADRYRTFDDLPAGMEVEVPDSSAFLLQFATGAYAVVHTSFVTRVVETDGTTFARIEVSGSGGVIRTHGKHGLEGYSGDARGPLAGLEPGPAYPQPYERFVNACLARDQSLIETSFEDGVKVAEIVDAAYRAWETRSWAKVGI